MNRIAVIGLGFVGLSYALVYSSLGVKCLGIDKDPAKINALRNGIVPIGEPKLDGLLKNSVNAGNISFSTDYKDIITFKPSIIFIAVDTPTKRSGQYLGNIEAAARSIGEVLKYMNLEYVLVVVKSTILPTVSRNVIIPALERSSGKVIGDEFGYVYNPEFLREGRAVDDILKPSRIVIGEYDRTSGDFLIGFYNKIYNKVGYSPPIIRTTIENAEISKYAANLFLACRLSYINSIAYLCQNIPNCDIIIVKKIMGMDDRIGDKYLHPGIGFGGGCLPKDLKAFIRYFNSKPFSQLFKSIDMINNYQPKIPVKLALKEYGDLSNRVITVLGLSYKENVADLRGSQAIKIIKEFLKKGANVKVFDPVSNDLFKEYCKKNRFMRKYLDKIHICKDLIECLSDSEFLIIATGWEIFKKVTPKIVKQYMRKPVIFDGRRILDYKSFKKEGVKFYGVGLSI